MNLRFKLDYNQQKYLQVAILCGIQTLLFSRNMYLSILVIAVQISYLLYLLACRKLIEAVVVYTIFLCMSLEFEYITGDFYGLKSFRVLGITIAVWIIFILFGATIVHYCNNRKRVNRDNEAKKILNSVLILNSISVIMGAILIVCNDNGIARNGGVLGAFAVEIYTVLSLVTIPTIILSYLSSYSEFREKMITAIHAILIVIVAQQYVSLIVGITGNVTGQEVPLVSSVQLYGPFLALYFVLKKQEYRKVLTIIGFLGWIISFKYSQGSGQYIMLFSIPIWIILIAVQKKEVNNLVKIIAMSMILLPVLFYVISNGNVAVQYKLEQALRFLNIWEKNWRMMLPMSSRVRVEELMDIFTEYSHKPYLLPFGKGIMGSIKDYTGFFADSQWALGTSAFSNFEWDAGAYYSVHETINKLLLSNGLLGLLFLGRMILSGVRNVKKTPIIAIGIMWLIWYWGYSTTISWFGLACLLVGFAEATCKEDNSTFKRMELL